MAPALPLVKDAAPALSALPGSWEGTRMRRKAMRETKPLQVLGSSPERQPRSTRTDNNSTFLKHHGTKEDLAGECEKPKRKRLETCAPGTSLAVQWLRLQVSTVGGVGSIPGWGTKIPQAARSG